MQMSSYDRGEIRYVKEQHVGKAFLMPLRVLFRGTLNLFYELLAVASLAH